LKAFKNSGNPLPIGLLVVFLNNAAIKKHKKVIIKHAVTSEYVKYVLKAP